jgi:transcriptional regulator with XRE-family HTH domain
VNLAEIGSQVQAKRIQTGLLQNQLAKLSGLSRVTINKLENGRLNDLGYAKLKIILDLVGLHIDTQRVTGSSSALAIAARNISTSYKEIVTASDLTDMLRSGDAPERFHAHLMALLDETPLPVVVRAISEAATPEASTQKIIKNLRRWADDWKTCRKVW